MAEMDWTLPTGLEKALASYYEAPQPETGFADRLQRKLAKRQAELLSPPHQARPGLSSRINMVSRALRTRPLAIILAIFLAFLLLFGVAYTVAKLSGYLPGFGFVEDAEKTYVLDEAVEMTRGGILVRVDKAVSDRNVFWVGLTVAGLPQELDFSKAFITLPDGKKMQSLSESGTIGESQRAYSFPPLDSQPENVTLLIENLGGQDFSLPLTLRRLQAGEILPIQPTSAEPLMSNSNEGVTLVLDHIAYASDKTILQLSLRFDQPNTWVMGRWMAQLTDPDGALYPLIDLSPGSPTGQGNDLYPLAATSLEAMDDSARIYQTVPFTGSEQLTLTLKMFPPEDEDVPLMIDFSAEQAGFVFDPGSNPQAGQEWQLDQTVEVGNYALHAVRARATSAHELVFEFEPERSLTGLMLYTPNPLVEGAAAGSVLPNGNITGSLSFDEFPAEPFEVRIMQVYYTAHGPWQIHWQPQPAPTGAGDATPTAGPTLEPYATPTLISNDSLLLEMEALVQKFDAPLQEGPGWVHLLSEQSSAPCPAGVECFPPPFIQTEEWFEIDASGFIIRSVHLDRDADGQVLQQSASIGNYTINFTTSDSGFNDAPPHPVSTDDLLQYLNQPEQPNITITRQEIPCEDGQSCIIVTMQESFPQPITNPGEEQAFWGAGRRVWVDTQTGQQVKIESFWLLEDGQELVTSIRRNRIAEKVTAPPQEILDILARVVVPTN